MVKPSTVLVIILGAVVVAGVIVGVVSGTFSDWFGAGPSKSTEVSWCTEVLRERVGSVTYTQGPSSDRRRWPHRVVIKGREHSATCEFTRDGNMSVEID